ncbi:uncharacterized protein ISCGN_010247 [Ixodes scapularis]
MAIRLEAALRVATITVRGLSARRRQCQLSRLFSENELDIIAVQETKIESQEQTDRMVRIFQNYFNVCVSHAVGFSAGCCLFIRRSIGVVETAVHSCGSGRFVYCDFSFSNADWRVLCVYAPNREGERKVFFESLSTYLDCERVIVFLGRRPQDRASHAPVRDASSFSLNDLVSGHCLEDVAACMNQGNVQFTHFQGRSHARLDRVYVSLDLLPLCSDYSVKHMAFSDHALVMFTLGNKTKSPKWDWALWKLNSSILSDEPFRGSVSTLFENLYGNDNALWAVRWDLFKEEVKMAAIERSSTLNYQKKKEGDVLRRQLNGFVTLESANPGEFMREIKECKSKLELIDVEKYRGAIVRARSDKLWLGEAPTKRALCDEKSYAQRNDIREICYGTTVTRDRAVIERAFVEHYRNLFGRIASVDDGFDADFLFLMPQLEQHVCDSLEVPITVPEIEAAIDELTSGKTPGPDGLGADFYKSFKHAVAPALYEVVTEAYEKQMLPLSFLRTHTVLIPKYNDSVKLLSVGSYRPITLTNVDYKIYMKILAKRLQRVIKVLVGPHQTCGIKGRTICTNIHVARSVLECCDAFQGRVAMLQLDFEKAFDRVSHQILFRILEHANVRYILLEGLKMAYKNCITSLVVNKRVTESIEIRCSVRQGCPLSPLLFAIFLEPFCLRLLRNDNVRGFKLNTNEVKVLSYADDLAVLCVDQESIREIVKVASSFCAKTGSVINWDKTVGFWHGDWDRKPNVFMNVRWESLPTKYLGVPLVHYRDSTSYWNEETQNVRTKAEGWRGKDLSIFARSTVCNVFLIAKIWYVLQVLYMSRANVQKFHRVLAVFLWNSNWERCARTNLFRSVRSGGLGLAHLFIRQIVSRFMFLRDQNDPFLRTVIQVRLQSFLPEFVVSSGVVIGAGVHGYMKEVLWSFRMLKVRFSMEYLATVSRKKLYKDLVDVLFPIPLYRSLYCVGGGLDVLKRVKRMPVRPCVKTFFFQLHCGVLPVKTWLEEKGLFVPWSTNCLLCKKAETVEHVFIECWDAVFHWDILQRTLKKDLPVNPRGIRYLAVKNEDEIPYDMIMLLSLHSMWKTRMSLRHADVNVRTVRENFIENIVYVREVYRALAEPPDWLPLLDQLASFKRF